MLSAHSDSEPEKELESWVIQKDKCTDLIAEAFEEYKDDPYMCASIHRHIAKMLHKTMKTKYDNKIQRTEHANKLGTIMQTFIDKFLCGTSYFYVPNVPGFIGKLSGKYYQYDSAQGKFAPCNESDIIQQIFACIPRSLTEWKFRAKVSILKKIKAKHVFSCELDDTIIQSVVDSLYPTYFPNKNAVEYFLIVLGNLFVKKRSGAAANGAGSGAISGASDGETGGDSKKSNKIVYIINSSTKQLVQWIASAAHSLLGIHDTIITGGFLQRYSEKYHKDNARMIPFSAVDPASAAAAAAAEKVATIELLCVARCYASVWGACPDDYARFCNVSFSLVRDAAAFADNVV